MRSFKTLGLVLGLLTSIANVVPAYADEVEESSGGAFTVESSDNLMALENLAGMFNSSSGSHEYFGRGSEGDRIRVNILINYLKDSDGTQTSVPDSAQVSLANEETGKSVVFFLARSLERSFVSDHGYSRSFMTVDQAGDRTTKNTISVKIDQRLQTKFWFTTRGQKQQLRVEMTESGIDISVKQGGLFGSRMNCAVDLRDIASRSHRQIPVTSSWGVGEAFLP